MVWASLTWLAFVADASFAAALVAPFRTVKIATVTSEARAEAEAR